MSLYSPAKQNKLSTTKSKASDLFVDIDSDGDEDDEEFVVKYYNNLINTTKSASHGRFSNDLMVTSISNNILSRISNNAQLKNHNNSNNNNDSGHHIQNSLATSSVDLFDQLAKGNSISLSNNMRAAIPPSITIPNEEWTDTDSSSDSNNTPKSPSADRVRILSKKEKTVLKTKIKQMLLEEKKNRAAGLSESSGIDSDDSTRVKNIAIMESILKEIRFTEMPTSSPSSSSARHANKSNSNSRSSSSGSLLNNDNNDDRYEESNNNNDDGGKSPSGHQRHTIAPKSPRRKLKKKSSSKKLINSIDSTGPLSPSNNACSSSSSSSTNLASLEPNNNNNNNTSAGGTAYEGHSVDADTFSYEDVSKQLQEEIEQLRRLRLLLQAARREPSGNNNSNNNNNNTTSDVRHQENQIPNEATNIDNNTVTTTTRHTADDMKTKLSDFMKKLDLAMVQYKHIMNDDDADEDYHQHSLEQPPNTITNIEETPTTNKSPRSTSNPPTLERSSSSSSVTGNNSNNTRSKGASPTTTTTTTAPTRRALSRGPSASRLALSSPLSSSPPSQSPSSSPSRSSPRQQQHRESDILIRRAKDFSNQIAHMEEEFSTLLRSSEEEENQGRKQEKLTSPVNSNHNSPKQSFVYTDEYSHPYDPAIWE